LNKTQFVDAIHLSGLIQTNQLGLRSNSLCQSVFSKRKIRYFEDMFLTRAWATLDAETGGSSPVGI